MRWLPLLLVCILMTGCDQGEEYETLRQENNRADTMLAELTEIAGNLPLRREQTQKLLAMRSAECAPPDPDEILRTVASLAPSAKVTMKGGELTFEGEGQSASTTLDGLAARAGYLSLEYLQVSPSGWRARLGIRLLCRSIPSDTPTVFPLPEKTDWIRAGPDRERKWLAKSQSKIQELENSLGHDPVRHLN